MFIISFSLAKSGMNSPEVKDGKLNTAARLLVGSSLGDAFVSLTAAVIAILGLLGTIHGMPPAASYALIGLSGFTTLTWLTLSILSKGDMLKVIKNTMLAAISSKPGDQELLVKD